jgi:hypothetical protein
VSASAIDARHRELGLSDPEYERIVDRLGREPNEVELAVFLADVVRALRLQALAAASRAAADRRRARDHGICDICGEPVRPVDSRLPVKAAPEQEEAHEHLCGTLLATEIPIDAGICGRLGA